jgi:hypothetical protein
MSGSQGDDREPSPGLLWRHMVVKRPNHQSAILTRPAPLLAPGGTRAQNDPSDEGLACPARDERNNHGEVARPRAEKPSRVGASNRHRQHGASWVLRDRGCRASWFARDRRRRRAGAQNAESGRDERAAPRSRRHARPRAPAMTGSNCASGRRGRGEAGAAAQRSYGLGYWDGRHRRRLRSCGA